MLRGFGRNATSTRKAHEIDLELHVAFSSCHNHRNAIIHVLYSYLVHYRLQSPIFSDRAESLLDLRSAAHNMATSHQPFPSRPYTSGLTRGAGGNTPFAGQTPFNAPQQNAGGYGAAGAATSQQQREAQRIERERQERQERERRADEERNALESLSEEQREEINEAVSQCTSARWIYTY